MNILLIDIIVLMRLLHINELNEVAETLKTTAYLLFGWLDPGLSWNPADYDGLEKLTIPQVQCKLY